MTNCCFGQSGMNTSKTDVIIKASFIYNFAKHSKWPDSDIETQKFRIAVLGDRNVFEELVDKYSTRAIQFNQAIEIVWVASVDELEDVQVVYVSKTKSDLLRPLQAVATIQNILVISEGEEEQKQKASISFVIVDNSISFNVNKKQATTCGIQLGNRILDWANNIIEQ